MLKKYKKKLESHGVSATIQRVKILEFLDKKRIHPTADQVYQGIKDRMVSLSKATVYNTLKLFSENGIVNELTLFDNTTRYEYNIDNHIHFKCISCDNIFDIMEEQSIYTKEFIDGHKITDYHISLRGICKDCLAKIEKKGDN